MASKKVYYESMNLDKFYIHDKDINKWFNVDILTNNNGAPCRHNTEIDKVNVAELLEVSKEEFDKDLSLLLY